MRTRFPSLKHSVEAIWLADFIISDIAPTIYCLERLAKQLSKCEGFDKELLKSCTKNLEVIKVHIEKIKEEFEPEIKRMEQTTL